jgi:hypothetical protein
MRERYLDWVGWSGFLNTLYWPILCISNACSYIPSPRSWLNHRRPYGLPHMHFDLIWIFLEDPLSNCAFPYGITFLNICLFRHCNTVTFKRNTIATLCGLLLTSFWPGSHEWASKVVSLSEDYPNVIPIPHASECLWNSLDIGDIHRTLGLNLSVPKTIVFGFITVSMKPRG